VEDLERQLETANKEQEALIDIFSEERSRRDEEEESLKEKLKVSQRQITSLFTTLLFRMISYHSILCLSLAGSIFHHTRVAGETERCQERSKGVRKSATLPRPH
jgi:hypothetical protein